MTQTSGGFVKQVVFLTVKHRGPLPLRELHSTGETRVWRDQKLRRAGEKMENETAKMKHLEQMKETY